MPAPIKAEILSLIVIQELSLRLIKAAHGGFLPDEGAITDALVILEADVYEVVAHALQVDKAELIDIMVAHIDEHEEELQELVEDEIGPLKAKLPEVI